MLVKFSKGFTLVEVMVTMVVIVTLALITIPKFTPRQPQEQLDQSIQVFRTTLELVRNRSATGVMACTGGDCDAVFTYSHGLYFELNGATPGQFFIYADQDGDLQYSAAADVIVKQYTLEKNVQFIGCRSDTVVLTYPPASSQHCDINLAVFGENNGIRLNGVTSSVQPIHVDISYSTDASLHDIITLYPATFVIQ